MSTLADKLVALPETPKVVRAQIVESQKFLLAEDLMSVISGLPAKAIEEGGQFCRLPFPTTWIEFRTHHPMQIGVLLRERLGSEGRAFAMWSFSHIPNGQPGAGYGLSPLVLRVVLNDPGKIKVGVNASEHLDPSEKAKVAARIQAGNAEKLPEYGSAQTCLSVTVATLMFMAAKDGASAEPVVHDLALQRAREKRGKLPMFEFHRLRLDLPASPVEPGGRGHADRTPMRGHTVRGHMMRSRAGLVWRRPHIRGDLSRGFVVKRYDLHGNPEARP